MNNNYVKILLQLVVFELAYIFMVRLGMQYFQFQNYGLIYLINTNLNFMLMVYAYLNFRSSRLNKNILIQIFVFYLYLTVVSNLALYITPELMGKYMYLHYNLMVILNALISLYLSVYIFFSILNTSISSKWVYWTTLLVCLIISSGFLGELIVTNQVSGYIANLPFKLLYMYVINFGFIVVFWFEYYRQKTLFTEYLSNILVIYSITIAIEIFHIFSAENNLILHLLGQYFNALLNGLMLLIFLARLNYLQSPESFENEKYLENYQKLHGLVEKPRLGFFAEMFYSTGRKTILFILLFVLLTGISLFTFNKFEIFIKYNIMLLILALVITTIFAMVYWYKYWFSSIEFLIRKKKNR